MNARVDTMWLVATACGPVERHAPFQQSSPELLAAVTALRGCLPADPTLEDMRRALLGTGFKWSSTGELAYRPDAELIDELDTLIAACGPDTPAALIPVMHHQHILEKGESAWRNQS